MAKQNKVVEEMLKQDGWWPCKYCTNPQWVTYHRPDETSCKRTGKTREESLLKDE